MKYTLIITSISIMTSFFLYAKDMNGYNKCGDNICDPKFHQCLKDKKKTQNQCLAEAGRCYKSCQKKYLGNN